MATLVANADGNFTAANIWDVVDTTSFLNSESGSTAVTTSNLDSATFTPGAITVKGICLKVHSRVVSPTGTTTITLRNSTDSTNVASVTVDNVDIAAALAGTSVAWIYFKFGSSQLLTAGKAYLIRATSSVTSQVTFFTNGTANNWSRMLPTTTTATIAAADAFHVLGELTGAGTGNDRTITMNQTTDTGYGNTTNASSIGHRGTLTWGTTAATNYILGHAGILEIGVGGTYNQGTTSTPMPRDSTAKLRFRSTATSSTAYLSRRGGTVVMQGQSRTSGKNVVCCNLSSDLAASGTTVNVGTDTGWKSGDEICISHTARSAGEGEKRTLSGDAGASSMTITAGVTYAHSASRLFNCKIGLLTRNVTIENDNSAYGTGLRSAGAAGSVNCDWVQFKHGDATFAMGAVSANAACTQEFDYCSITDAINYGMIVGSTGGGTISFRNGVIWNPSTSGTSYNPFFNNTTVAGTTITFTDNMCVAGTNACSGMSLGQASTLGAVTGNFVAGFTTGVQVGASSAAKNTAFSLDSNTAVVCTTGFSIALANVSSFTITDMKAYHCTTSGIALSSARNITFASCETHGNTTNGVILSAGGTGFNVGIRFIDLLTGSTTGFTQANGVATGATSNFDTIFQDTVFSASGSGKEPNTTEVLFTAGTFGNICEVKFTNPTKQSIAITSTAVPTGSTLDQQSHISFSRINGTTDGTGDYTVTAYGRLEYDSSVYHTAAPSLKVTSLYGTSSLKMQSAPAKHRQRIAVASGATITASVWTRTSAAYDGNQPRLMVTANAAAGIDNDTALDTMTVGTATWEQLSGTTATVADDCVLEFYVDCDGTAGYVNVDDWTLGTATNDMTTWVDVLPTPEMTVSGGGGGGIMLPRSVNGL